MNTNTTQQSLSISGPLLVSFGGLLILGDFLVIGLTIQQSYKKKNASQAN